MPADRGERRIEEALAALTAALDSTKVRWMVIGGIAAIVRGVRRMTSDIDVVVRGDDIDIGALLGVLAKHRIAPRIDDALEFARENLVLLLRHQPSGVDLDLSFGWTAFEHEALEGREQAYYGRFSLPVARAEDLVIFKAMAARPKDVEDACVLLLLHRGIDLGRVRRRLHELALLADEPELELGLETIIAKAGAERPRPTTKPARFKPMRKVRPKKR